MPFAHASRSQEHSWVPRAAARRGASHADPFKTQITLESFTVLRDHEGDRVGLGPAQSTTGTLATAVGVPWYSKSIPRFDTRTDLLLSPEARGRTTPSRDPTIASSHVYTSVKVR